MLPLPRKTESRLPKKRSHPNACIFSAAATIFPRLISAESQIFDIISQKRPLCQQIPRLCAPSFCTKNSVISRPVLTRRPAHNTASEPRLQADTAARPKWARRHHERHPKNGGARGTAAAGGQRDRLNQSPRSSIPSAVIFRHRVETLIPSSFAASALDQWFRIRAFSMTCFS